MSEIDRHQYQLTPEGRFALWIVGGEIVAFAIVCSLMTAQVALGTCISLASVVLAMRLLWTERTRVWYWLFSSLAVVGQLPLIKGFPWGNRDYGPFVFMLVAADFIVVWGLLKLGQVIFAEHS